MLISGLFPLLLFSSSLRLPFWCDDFMLFSEISGNSYAEERNKLSIYTIVDPEITRNHPYVNPWWTSPDTKIRFLRPFPSFLWRLDFLVWGKNPAGYHLTNVLIQSLASVCLFLIGRLLFGKDEISLIGTLIFICNPCCMFSVAWVSDRVSLLALACGLLGLYSHIHFRKKENMKWLFLTWLCFNLAFLSRESGGKFIAVYFLYDWFVWRQERPDRWPGLLKLTRFYIVFSLSFLVFLAYFLKAGYGVIGQYSIFGQGETVWNSFIYLIKNAVLYMGSLLFLVPINADRITALVLILIAGLFLYPGFKRRTFRDPVFLFLGSWLILSLLPILPMITQFRFVYEPAAPFGLALSLYLFTMKWGKGFGRLTRLVFYGALLYLVVFPPILLSLKFPSLMRSSSFQVELVESTLSQINGSKGPGPVNVFFINMPLITLTLALQHAFDFHSAKDRIRSFPLFIAREIPEVTVLGEQSFRITAKSDLFSMEDGLTRMYLTDKFKEGFSRSNDFFKATVEQVENGSIRSIRFDFKEKLDDDSMKFFVVKDIINVRPVRFSRQDPSKPFSCSIQ